jgi:hypothetical protein
MIGRGFFAGRLPELKANSKVRTKQGELTESAKACPRDGGLRTLRAPVRTLETAQTRIDSGTDALCCRREGGAGRHDSRCSRVIFLS